MCKQYESTVQQINAARISENSRFVVKASGNDSTVVNKHIVTEDLGTYSATKDEYKNLDWCNNHKSKWVKLYWAGASSSTSIP